MNKVNKSQIIFLIVILIVQLVFSIYLGNQKKSYYIDDVWSFEISQGTYDFIKNKYAEKWNKSDVLKEKIVIEGDEKFNLLRVRKAVEQDAVHPPLYYFLLNIFGSLFNFVSLYNIALYLNIVISLLITFILFLIFRKIKEKDKDIDYQQSFDKNGILFFIPSIFWCFLTGALKMVILFRMYLLLMLFSLLALYFVILIYKKIREDHESIPKKYLVFLGLVLTGGFLTHFYFSFYAFILIIILLLNFLHKKHYTEIIQVGVASLASLILVHIIYPKFLYFMFSSYQTKYAFEEATTNVLDLIVKGCSITVTVVADFLKIKWLDESVVFVIGSLLFLLLIVLLIRIIVKRIKNTEEGKFKSILTGLWEWTKIKLDSKNTLVFMPHIVMFLFIVVFARFNVDRYLSIIYLLFLFIISYAVYKFAHFIKRPAYSVFVILIISFILGFNSFTLIPKEYKYKEKNVAMLKDFPAIVITNAIGKWSKNIYAADVEAMLPTLINFPAEIHASEDVFMNNILGMTFKDIRSYGMTPFEIALNSKIDTKFPAKDYMKYNRSPNHENYLVLFIEHNGVIKKETILATTMKRLGFEYYNRIERIKLTTSYSFDMFVLFN